MTATPAPDSAAIGARGATGVGIASLLAAASSYGVVVLAAHALSKADNADFLSFWGLLFFLFGTLGGLQNEATRSVHVAGTRTATRAPGSPILRLGLLVGLAGAALVLLTAPIWQHAVLGADTYLVVVLVAVALVAFSGHSTVAGTLAGRGYWTLYARLVGAEASVRLALAALAVAVGAGAAGLRVATAAGAATWLGFTVSSRVRAVRRQRTDGPAAAFLSGSGHAMIGAASSAALVVGFPVLLRLTTPSDSYVLAAPLLLAVTFTRAPLLIPLSAYQGVAITHFIRRREDGLRPLLQIAGAILAAALLGSAAAALVGPWLMVVILGPGYRVAPWVLAALTLTAGALALLTLTGAAVLALGEHRRYALGWLAATVCSALVLLVPGSLEPRVIASLALGPVIGVIVHATALGHRRTVRR